MKTKISTNSFNMHSLDRFTKNYTQYYGKSPVITEKKKGNLIRIKGITESLSNKTLSQMATFYAWRTKKDLYPKDDITDDDFNQFTYWLSMNWMSKKCVSVLLGISSSSFTSHHSNCSCVKTAYLQTLSGQELNKSEEITWNNITMNAMQWAAYLDMTTMAFRARRYKHGICNLTFLSKEEYRAIPKKERDKHVNTEEIKKNTGNTDYQLLNKKSIKTHKVVPEYVKKDIDSVSYNAALSLVAAIIEDSKLNLIKGDLTKRTAKYFSSSKSFLMNRNGQLFFYLDAVKEINCKSALKELYEFANSGYKNEQSEEVRTATESRTRRLSNIRTRRNRLVL